MEVLIHDLGLPGIVEMKDGYMNAAELQSFILGGDIALLPYDNEEQVTSGVLIEHAIGLTQRRSIGYTPDDVARALVVAVRWPRPIPHRLEGEDIATIEPPQLALLQDNDPNLLRR